MTSQKIWPKEVKEQEQLEKRQKCLFDEWLAKQAQLPFNHPDKTDVVWLSCNCPKCTPRF